MAQYASKAGFACISGKITTGPKFQEVGKNATPLCTLSVLVGHKGENGVFVDVKAWNDLAVCLNECQKGDFLFATGAVRTESWTDRQTQMGRTRKVFVADFVTITPGGHATNQKLEGLEDSDVELPF